MTPATLLGVWANPDDEAYLSAGLMARARDRLVEHRGVRRSHGHAGSTSRSSAARAGPLVTEVGRSAHDASWSSTSAAVSPPTRAVLAQPTGGGPNGDRVSAASTSESKGQA